MDAQDLKASLARKRPVIGTWAHLAAPMAVEAMGAAGLDFVVFDLEHGPISVGDLPVLFCAAERRGMVPMVRLAAPDDRRLTAALDAGAGGVMVPHVTSRAEAEGVLGALHYGDQPGSRGVAALTRASLFDDRDEAAFRAAENARLVSVLMIEDREGLEALPEISRLAGVDVVFLGLYDLAQSLGFGAGHGDPRFAALLARAIGQVGAAGVAAGCYARDAGAAKRLIERGVGFVTVGVDGAMLRWAYEAVLAGIRDTEGREA